jgi:hypothetical protein
MRVKSYDRKQAARADGWVLADVCAVLEIANHDQV